MMLNQWFKLAILALVGIIVGSLAIGAISGFDNQLDPNHTNGSHGNVTPGYGYAGYPGFAGQPGPCFAPGSSFGPGSGIQNNMPGMNVQENMNVRVQGPNGMNVQINETEGMNNMRGMK